MASRSQQVPRFPVHQGCPQGTKVDFYLYLQDAEVDQVHINWFNISKQPIPLNRILILSLGAEELWKLTWLFSGDITQLNHVRYNYSISSKQSNKSCQENHQRNMGGSPVHFDVFRFTTDNKKFFQEIVPKAILCYSYCLLPLVNDAENIKEILAQVEKLRFDTLKEKAIEQLLEWILETAINSSVSDVQCFYLCVVLSRLPCQLKKNRQLADDRRTKRAFDRLLQCLTALSNFNFLSPSSLQNMLQRISHVLVRNSSCRGWLTFAVHFYSYLGVEYVVHSNKPRGNYEWDEYRRMVAVLLAHVNLKPHTDRLHRKLLEKILQNAPVMDHFPLKDDSVNSFFHSKQEKQDFFVKIYRSGKSKKSVKKLVEIVELQKTDRPEWSDVVHTSMLDFVMSGEKPEKKEEEAFLQLITTDQDMSKDKVQTVLVQLSKSKSVPHHNLLLILLNEKMFEPKWKDVSLKDKSSICSSWIDTRVNNQKNESGLTAAVYQAIHDLVSCSLIDSVQDLAEDLFKHISERLKDEGHDRILKAFKNVEDLSSVVQEAYRNRVKAILQQNPRLLKKPSETLKQWSQSSFGQSLLSCVLDVLDIPVQEENRDRENVFPKMLEWCDIWTILLSAQGCVEHAQFKAGIKIWQALQTCIAEGNISPNFLEIVKQHESKLSLISAALCVEDSNSNNQESRHRKFLDRITELVNIKKDLHKKFGLLESVINYEEKVSGDSHLVDGMPEVIREFNKRKDNFLTMKMNELHDNFWGPLFPLLDTAELLLPLMSSISFKNVNFATTDGEGVPNNVYSLIELLTRKRIERFEALWNPVFNNPGSMNLETMKTLLKGLKNKEKLEEEFSILEQYFKPQRLSPDVKHYMEDYVTYPDVLNRVNEVISVLDTFGLLDLTNPTVATLTTFAEQFNDREETDLKELHEAKVKVLKILSQYIEGETRGVMEELSRSSELHAFVKETVNEDIRFLIDAVEEHSDQFVSESLVSDLIDVHRFLAPLMKYDKKPELFLMQLVHSCKDRKDIAVKIEQCSTNVNSLKGLYTSVANRGEITKEIIANCLSNGVYTVSLGNGGICEATMSYEKSEKSDACSTTNYSLSELHDLRSRAHLIVSSDKNPQKLALADGKENDNFAGFIEQVNLLTDITSLLLKLRSSGYVKYRSEYWKKMKGTKELQDTKDILQKEFEEWEKTLSDARQKYYFINYYRSDQLCVLHDFLTGRTEVRCEEVLSLINFVDPNIMKEHLEAYRETHPLTEQNEASDNPYDEMLSIIGNALEEIFAKTNPTIRPIVNNQERPAAQHSAFDSVGATVKTGELFVASLEEESPLTANVMLTLYENTSNAFPEPNQVVFCGPQTTWEAIRLVLQRCFAQSKYLKQDSLFCIANVELLANEVQFKLVNVIKEKQNSVDEYGPLEGNADYRLALICRGGDHHHIVEVFAQYSHRIAGMSDLTLSQHLRSRWPGVKIITSTLPGLGKTERIKEEMLETKKNIVTFSISGPLDQSKIIQRLKELNIKISHHGLHLDIGEINDPFWLDTFLFQLVVIGMVSSGTQFYHRQTDHVYIEIANTLNDRLRESLVLAKCFTRVHLQSCSNYEDLLVSSRVTSKLQVVCQYLDMHARGTLESTDVHFTGPQKVKPLPEKRCQDLLAKYYPSNPNITFTTLNTFLGVLAKQLLKFSRSAFFKIANLKSMLGDGARGVRTNLFRALLDVSKEFASLSQEESVQTLEKTVVSSGMSGEQMVERVKGMIQWEDSNHLLVTFHGENSQAIGAIYRDKNLVPENVENLLKSQVVRRQSKQLEDFKLMSQDQLKEKLVRIACTKPPKESQDTSSYALTPDNILKMILIILRVRANVPVIIMGETGCGKTSLVRYLANICQIQFSTFSCHAGITEEEIKEFIKEKRSQAKTSREQIWVFLDEINTCDHLGLICDVMCHHTLFGRPLPKNLVFLAACNPYELRTEEQIQTAGLEGKNVVDEYSRLVYRVHPLPEAMIVYVWDYGSLAPKDETAYIHRMVEMLPANKYRGVLVELLAKSQKFIRDAENNHFCVSLRDVRRCILLVQWFMEMLEKRKNKKESQNEPEYPKRLQNHYSVSKKYDEMPFVKSIVLALAHCYLSRLPTAEKRKSYRQCMMNLFSGTGTIMKNEERVDSFSAIVRMEEEYYLDRMELPSGTARNAALRENVFVMLVSILNRIPVFVVGKPGCSKSLSMQLIRSNLRGRDSKHSLFRQLPQLYVVSHQGSESSTSEGIIKVFEKAYKYKSHNKDENVLPVVLLDEVGLAENSKCNPLKVLHSLLEPGDGKLPNVAVVGISNWALDAAKMNRAIHLSRPKPTIIDLIDTGFALLHADSKEDDTQTIKSNDLICLAEAYDEYQSNQRHSNFHGLRDYYSLIKSLSLSGGRDLQQINMALQRNFGGIPGELTNIQKIFLDKLKQGGMLSSGEDIIIPPTKLIQKNLEDTRARHLMLITSGDSAIGILKQSLTQLNKEIITIFGSRFEEDLFEDYNYRILSRIILCMELDCILILRDLERIYGSLYDMLNQNYAVVGKRKNCRVALGAYSNPMCHVNDNFRCVVLTDHHKIDFSDPPFLNRFEKQLLRFSDVLNEKQQEIITELNDWIQQISTVQGYESQFKESDMFIGFHEDTLPSLVRLHSHNTDEPNEEIVQRCKDDLMWVATPDGVLRAQKCDLFKKDSREVESLSEGYFEKTIHDGLAYFMETVMHDHETGFLSGDEIGSKTIIMTYSSVHTDISKCLGDAAFTCQTERLGAYKSEKQLAERVDHFWLVSEKDLLVLQCKPELDSAHMLLARSIIEDKRSRYEKSCQQTGNVKQSKHVCIVVHVQRGTTDTNAAPWQFSFLCGWKQVFLDVLEEPPVSLNEIRTESIEMLLTSSIWPLRTIAQNELLWCFTCIKYTQQQRPLDSILQIANSLFRSEPVYHAINQLILEWVNAIDSEEIKETGPDETWQVKVACDRQALINSSTLSSAMEKYVSRLVCQPLAKIIYFLEKENAWPPHVFDVAEDEDSEPEYEDMWCNLISNRTFFNMSEIPDPHGPESYILDSVSLDLQLPFSQVVIRRVDAMKDLVLEDYTQANENESNSDNGQTKKPNVELQQIQRYSEIIANAVPEIHDFPVFYRNSYMDDLFDILSADFKQTNRRLRVSIAKSAFVSYIKQSVRVDDVLHFYVQLHLFVWISKEKILDQLRLVDSCQHFIRSEALEHLTDEVLSSQDALALSFPQGYSDSENESTEETEEYSSEDETKVSQNRHLEVDADETNNNMISDELEEDSEFTLKWSEDKADEHESEEEENGEEQESFEDVLVTIFCEEMLPSQETVENGGIESWIRNASLVLLLASKITHQIPALHFLRLCVDFAYMTLVSSTAAKRAWYPLYILNEIAVNKLKPEYLDTNESFEDINELLIKPLEDQVKGQAEKRVALQKFSALFYGRCIDTNVDTHAAREIVEQVLSLEGADLVLIMSPVILRLLMLEEMVSPGIFVNIITNQNLVENCSCLQNVDEVFKELYTKDLIHHDSYAAVMVCDLIQSLLKLDDQYSIEDINSSDCELLQCVHGAAKVLFGNEQDNRGLVLLASVAFLRAFFAMLSSFIAEKPNVVTADSSFSRVMSEINSLLLIGDACRRSSLQMFFLKQLHQTDMSLFDLRKLCQESKMLPALNNVFIDNRRIPKAEFVFVCELSEYEQVQVAYSKLFTKEDGEKMVIILDQCRTSPNHRLALMQSLGNEIYLKRAERKLTDKEECLAKWFSDKLEHFPVAMKEILMRIIGQKNFDHPQMQLSPESSVDEVQIVSLILHISCVLASGVQGEASLLKQDFSDPLKCKQTYILAHGENRTHRAFENRKSANGPSPFTCPCGLRILFKDDESNNKCSYCKTKRVDPNPEKPATPTAETSSTLSKGNLPPVAATVPTNPPKRQSSSKKPSQWDDCTDTMSPFVFRALHLIDHACLYAWVAMGIYSKKDLLSLLNLKGTPDSDTGTCQDPVEICFDHIKADLKFLTTILCCTKQIAIKAMYLVVEKCAELFRGKPVNKNTSSTLEQRLEWEAEFSNIVKEVLPEALGSAKNLKKVMRNKPEEENKESTKIEDQIQELDEYPAEPVQQNRQLKRLFRVTRQPSLKEFHSTFVNASKEFQEKHSFLLLFFAKFDKLPKIRYLSSLLKWARLVSSTLTHRISRKDAMLSSIDDFINGYLLKDDNKSQDDIKSQKTLFKDFKEAWNNMCEFVNQELPEKSDEMPRLRETDSIAYCLPESDYGVYLVTAIRILVSLQNSILDEMIFLSTQRQHSALRFLEKDNSCSGVPSISIQEAKEKDIIHFRWSDELFRYAQNNLEYGQGENVSYDFEQMEIELAKDVAFGKCHLTGSLNKLIFSKELFHTSGPMLTEIRELFPPQSPKLPDNVRQGLSSLKERRIQDAQNLLQHIEVLIFLLKLKLKSVSIDVEMTLEKFVDMWTTMFPSPFPVSLLPEPRGSIKVKHIAAFYEALEDLLADGAIEGLPKQFREDLTDETKNQLECLVDNKDGPIKLQTLLNALRRFVFRYLSSEKFLPEPNTPLSSCLKESSLWSPAQPPDSQVIPKEITLECIYSIITHLQELDKERKGDKPVRRRPTARPLVSKKGGRRSFKF